jgi:cellulose synthase operon protein C
VLMVSRGGSETKGAAFAEAKEHLKTAADACAANEVPPGLGRWYKRVVTKLAAEAGGLTPRFWAWWQQSRPWVR